MAVDFIADLRQASDVAAVPIGRDVVGDWGGMTAIRRGHQRNCWGR